MDKKLRTNGKLKSPDEAGGYIIEKYSQCSAPRFIWKKKKFGDNEILILRDALSHDEYISKYNTGSEPYWDKILKFSPEEESELKEYWQSIIDNGNRKEDVSLNHLTTAESNFLHSPVSINPELFKDTVYEKKGWLDYFAAKGERYMANYGEALEELIVNHPSENKKSGWISAPIPNDDKEVIAVYHQVRKEANSLFHDWVLFGVVAKGTDLYEEYKEVFDPTTQFEDARIGARRSYPFTMLDDKDYWQKMENDTSSNMILSSEESDVIGANPEYPMFISGRAGSGKSTVLQYLFAEIIIRYLQSCLFEEAGESLSIPVYLSYSESLIEKAQELTESLFSHNHIYQKELKDLHLDYKEDVEPLIKNGMFCVFDKLVRNLIAEHNERDLQNFDSAKRISFARFKYLWKQKFSKSPQYRKYGPSICWHIIKTYIKGWDSSTYLSPEGYRHIGRDNQTVPNSTYEFVFDKIWSKWYSGLREDGFWDDQDLVRFCLHPSDDPDDTCVEPSYSAVFCDESQDFTRIELELILGLSTLSHRTLVNSADVYKIPFIFAGDEFQTLSPTGFSWDSLRSFFNRELARHLNIDSSEFSPSEPIQLVNNYRSAGSIVKLGNRLQLLRGSRFKQPSKPQQTYFTDLGAPVLYFPEDVEVISRLKSKNLILIVPADDGMTAKEYIESTPLKGLIEFYDNGTPKEITILNPAQAKGLDYDNVAIYGFGNGCQHLSSARVVEYLHSHSEPDTEFEKEIDARYHLNNAYVAVTRAKERLFVIDSNIADSLWGLAIETPNSTDIQAKMISLLPDYQKDGWNDSVLGYMIKGRLDDIVDNGNTNWLESIKSIKDKALKEQEYELMEQAAFRYKEREEIANYHMCRGYAYEMKDKHEAAAEEFLKAGMYEEAVRHLWLSIRKDNLNGILKKLNDNAAKSDSKDALLASRIYKANTLKAIKECLYDLSEGINEEGVDSKERSIRKILAEHLLNQLPKVELNEISQLNAISDLIVPFQGESDFRIDTLISRLETLKEYKKIIEVCDRQKSKNYGKPYYKAKIELSQYPEHLLYFEKAYDNWQQRVFKEYQSNKKELVTSDAINFIIANAVLACSDNKTEVGRFAALVLSLDTSTERIRKVLEKTDKLGIALNKDALNLLLAIRQMNTEQLKQTIVSDGVEKMKDLANSARSILEILSKDFKFDERLLKAGVSNYFNERFKHNVKGILTTPYLLLLGNKIEERRQYLDNIHYFEWAGKQAYSEEKRLFSLLVLKNEELKDCNGDLDSFIPRVNKRRELNLGPTIDELDKTINAETIKAWQRIFQFFIDKMKEPTIAGDPKRLEIQPGDKVPQNKDKDLSINEISNKDSSERNDSSILEENKKPVKEAEKKSELQEPFLQVDNASLPNVEFFYGDLKITFDFQKERLKISHTKSDQKVTVARNGRIHDDDEFVYHEDGRLELEGKLIDLSIKLDEKDIILSHISREGMPTGLYFRFPRLGYKTIK
ncbi:MAG: hypothetical protein K2H60_00470 [Muribaculaceae bacterium]|nr:hypothetical protein [Muribaculaceae bacterium]